MRAFVFTLFFAVLSAQSSYALDSVCELFKEPLILGASMSADQLAPSPGKKIARACRAKPVVYARGGRPGVDTLPTIPEDEYEARSVFVGLDLFFWDAVRPCNTGLDAIRRYFDQAGAGRAHHIVATLPRFEAGLVTREPDCRMRINALLREGCEGMGARCHLFDLDQVVAKVRAAGGARVHYQGRERFYLLAELMPDGLHPSDVGSTFLADELTEQLRHEL